MTCRLIYANFERASDRDAYDLTARVIEHDGTDRGLWTLHIGGTMLKLIHPEEGAAPPSVIRALGELLSEYAHTALQEDQGPDARYHVFTDRDRPQIVDRAPTFSNDPLTDGVLATFDC